MRRASWSGALRSARYRSCNQCGRPSVVSTPRSTPVTIGQGLAFFFVQVEQLLTAHTRSSSAAQEWADLIRYLQRLQRVLTKYSQLPIIPDKILVAKRLFQCLNSSLPSGGCKCIAIRVQVVSTPGPGGRTGAENNGSLYRCTFNNSPDVRAHFQSHRLGEACTRLGLLHGGHLHALPPCLISGVPRQTTHSALQAWHIGVWVHGGLATQYLTKHLQVGP